MTDNERVLKALELFKEMAENVQQVWNCLVLTDNLPVSITPPRGRHVGAGLPTGPGLGRTVSCAACAC